MKVEGRCEGVYVLYECGGMVCTVWMEMGSSCVYAAAAVYGLSIVSYVASRVKRGEWVFVLRWWWLSNVSRGSFCGSLEVLCVGGHRRWCRGVVGWFQRRGRRRREKWQVVGVVFG